MSYGLRARGVEGYVYENRSSVTSPDRDGNWLVKRINAANAAESSRIWQLVEPGYQPIDWQIDFKSGYRWSERVWYRDIKVAPRPGADIKVPWELARSQHFPQLAMAYLCAQQERSGFRLPIRYQAEFRNQVLDFIAANPPQFGVNWACAMDVGIRIVNWLLAYALFVNWGATFDREFESIFARSVMEHGRFIAGNLEWNKKFRSNHYLADLLGLLFASAFLKRSKESDEWMAFSVAEMIHEMHCQFYPDGGNFEGSLSYHCLSTEMIILGVGIILGQTRERLDEIAKLHPALCGISTKISDCPSACHPLPHLFTERLWRAIELARDLRLPNGSLPVIGDQDSGRALKIAPVFHRCSVAEMKASSGNLVDYEDSSSTYLLDCTSSVSNLLRYAYGLYERNSADPHSWLIHLLSKGELLPKEEKTHGLTEHKGTATESWEALTSKSAAAALKRVYTIDVTPEATQGVVARSYPHCGLYLFRSERFYLLVRCGEMGQNGVGGHSHFDQLSMELWVDGRCLIRDPGTYLYTAHPELRNRYRSASAHFGPYLASVDRQYLAGGLFQFDKEFKGESLWFSEREFVGRVRQGKDYVYRSVQLLENGLTVCDWTTARGCSWEVYNPPPFSGAYGWRESHAAKLEIGHCKPQVSEMPPLPK